MSEYVMVPASAAQTWRPVSGYEDRYEVSDRGDVRKRDGSLLKQWPNGQGYMLVRLSGPRALARVHRLVAEAFLDNADRYPFVNHIDFDTANNRAENLEWCTQAENLKHSEAAGRMQKDYWIGRRSPNADLTNETAAQIRRDYSAGGVSWSDLAGRYGISKRTVGRIVRGETYV